MIDALLAGPEVREALSRYRMAGIRFQSSADAEDRKECEDAERHLISCLLTALAAQPEGETLRQAVAECMQYANAHGIAKVDVQFLVGYSAAVLRAPLHARVATLEAEADGYQAAIFEGRQENEQLRAERDRLREYAQHKPDCRLGWPKIDGGGACTCGLAALTGGGR